MLYPLIIQNCLYIRQSAIFLPTNFSEEPNLLSWWSDFKGYELSIPVNGASATPLNLTVYVCCRVQITNYTWVTAFHINLPCTGNWRVTHNGDSIQPLDLLKSSVIGHFQGLRKDRTYYSGIH